MEEGGGGGGSGRVRQRQRRLIGLREERFFYCFADYGWSVYFSSTPIAVCANLCGMHVLSCCYRKLIKS